MIGADLIEKKVMISNGHDFKKQFFPFYAAEALLPSAPSVCTQTLHLNQAVCQLLPTHSVLDLLRLIVLLSEQY